MFASLAFLLAAQQIVIPLGGTPPQVERLPAPIAEYGPLWARTCAGDDGWDSPAPPVRINGNTYLVGTCGIASILITGDDGHILIDGGTEKGADVIAENIRSLGFKPSDVKILLISHEHLDHVGGIANLQALTGAQLYVSDAARTVMNSGKVADDDPQKGVIDNFKPAVVARTVRDGENIRLGNIMLTAMLTPGHTAGATSWRWVACEGGVCPTIVYADSLSPVSRDDYKFSAHPDLVATFRKSFAKIAASPCDILLTPHPGASNMPDRLAGKAPLRDENGCKAYAAAKAKALDERLAKEGAQ